MRIAVAAVFLVLCGCGRPVELSTLQEYLTWTDGEEQVERRCGKLLPPPKSHYGTSVACTETRAEAPCGR